MIPVSLDMGRYAAFIWPAYAVSAAGFGWMIADTLARCRRWRRDAEGRGGTARDPGPPPSDAARRGSS